MSSSNPLGAASEALKHAEKSFPGAMAKSVGVEPAGERIANATPPKPTHEYSKAPYSLAKEANDVSEGIKWRAAQRKALDQ